MSDIDSQTVFQAGTKKRTRSTSSLAPIPPLLLTESEAAKLLSVSSRVLWGLTNKACSTAFGLVTPSAIPLLSSNDSSNRNKKKQINLVDASLHGRTTNR